MASPPRVSTGSACASSTRPTPGFLTVPWADLIMFLMSMPSNATGVWDEAIPLAKRRHSSLRLLATLRVSRVSLGRSLAYPRDLRFFKRLREMDCRISFALS